MTSMATLVAAMCRSRLLPGSANATGNPPPQTSLAGSTHSSDFGHSLNMRARTALFAAVSPYIKGNFVPQRVVAATVIAEMVRVCAACVCVRSLNTVLRRCVMYPRACPRATTPTSPCSSVCCRCAHTHSMHTTLTAITHAQTLLASLIDAPIKRFALRGLGNVVSAVCDV
jgi:hypothetical protein